MISVVAGSSSGTLCGGCQLVIMAVVSWHNRNMKFVRKFNFSNFCVTQKIGKNGKKVKLNGLIHSKIVLVEDHIEYEKKTGKSDHSNLIGRLLSEICYGT
jgi:hypothetical protein